MSNEKKILYLLNQERRRLATRRFVRAAWCGLSFASMGFLFVAPIGGLTLYLLGDEVLRWPMLGVPVVIGFLAGGVGFWRYLRSTPVPAQSQAALSLESRLSSSDGSLPTWLETRDEPFGGILAAGALAEARAALNSERPPMFQTNSLVLTPVLWFCVALVVLTWSQLSLVGASLDHDRERVENERPINVASGRSDEDAAAVTKAKGLATLSTKARQAAKEIRQSRDAKSASDARDAMARDLRENDEVPMAEAVESASVGSDESRKDLARRLELWAGKASGGSGEESATGAASGGGSMANNDSPPVMVKMPALETTRGNAQPRLLEPRRRALIAKVVSERAKEDSK